MGADLVIPEILACIEKALAQVGAGTWPDWVAAVGTSLAFGIAALAYRRDVTTRREAQARQVYSMLQSVDFYHPGDTFELLALGAGGGTMPGFLAVGAGSPGKSIATTPLPIFRATIRVHNGSDELIAPVKVQIIDEGLKARDEGAACHIGAVEPHSDHLVEFIAVNPHSPGQPSLLTTALFRDSSGQWWRRTGTERIERVHDDPENPLPLPAERAQYAQNARAMGLTPSPEPKVPLVARWHRFWRMRRGKSSTP